MPDTHHHPAVEAETGLAPWKMSELPMAPRPHGLGWLSAVGPGVIVLGMSIGSGEFLLGPAAFVNYGFSILWITLIAVFLQTILNTELIRYTLATGEPASSGFMRTRPGTRFWALVYMFLFLLQLVWPAWAGAGAAAIYFFFSRRLPGPTESGTVYWIGVLTFLFCVAVLLVGRRIVETLELFNKVFVICMIGAFSLLTIVYVDPETWLAALTGFAGFDFTSGRFDPLPPGVDFFLISALAAYSGCGGMGNITLSNWARDKGYGMSQVVGFIPAAFGGQKVNLAHTGATFEPNDEAMSRWNGWWRIVRADQWGVFFTGALLGMLLPALLYVTFLRQGTEIRGIGIAAALASAMASQTGAIVGGLIAFLAAWMLLKSQLDNIEGFTRTITDILWTGSPYLRTWRGGDVRFIYYTVLAVFTLWGVIALRLAEPIFLLQISANVGAVIMIVASLHILYINTRLLAPELRPPLWRRICLAGTALFYAFFVTLWIVSALF